MSSFRWVGTHEENGSFEVIPRTQYVANEDPQSEMDDVLGPGSNQRDTISPNPFKFEGKFALGPG